MVCDPPLFPSSLPLTPPLNLHTLSMRRGLLLNSASSAHLFLSPLSHPSRSLHPTSPCRH